MTDTSTDETTTDEATTTDAPVDDTDAQVEDEVDDLDEEEKSDDRDGREAAKYRTRLRAAEAERDAALERVRTWQRAEVERLTAAQLAAPRDLWMLEEVKLDDLLDPDGLVDPDAVADTLDGVLKARPHWRKAEHADARRMGAGGRSTPGEPEPGRVMGDLLRGAADRSGPGPNRGLLR